MFYSPHYNNPYKSSQAQSKMENTSYNPGRTDTPSETSYKSNQKNQGEEIKPFMDIIDKERKENVPRPNRIKFDLTKFLK